MRVFAAAALAHAGALAASIFVIATLLTVASAMQWDETAQLLANTPTMIVEAALLLVLMASQVAGEGSRAFRDLPGQQCLLPCLVTG